MATNKTKTSISERSLNQPTNANSLNIISDNELRICNGQC